MDELEIMEAFASLYIDDEDDVFEEGSTINYLDKMKKEFNKPFKDATKACNKAIRAKDFKTARKELDTMKMLVDKLDRDIRDIPESDLTDTVLCGVIGILHHALRNVEIGAILIALSAVMAPEAYMGKGGLYRTDTPIKKLSMPTAVAGGTIIALTPLVSILSAIRDIDKSNKTGMNKYNLMISEWQKFITHAQKYLSQVETKIDKAEAKIKKAKTVKESAAFKSAKLAIYEACDNGEISDNQKDELLNRLNLTFK